MDLCSRRSNKVISLCLLYICFLIPRFYTSNDLFDVENCPVTAASWDVRAANLTCTRDKQGNTVLYHCLTMYPNESLVETCMIRQPVDPSKQDGCPTLYISKDSSKNIYFTDCAQNVSGCPKKEDSIYYTNTLWKYRACFKKEVERINNIRTSTVTMSVLNITGLRNTTNMLSNEQDNRSQPGFVIPLVVALFCIVVIISVIVIVVLYRRRRHLSTCYRAARTTEENEHL